MNKLLATMIAIAATAHENQFDKAGRPYILHCLKVMHYLPDNADDELRCIAVGHDLFEDTKVTTVDLMGAGFSDRVIGGICAMTKQRGQAYLQYKEQVKANRDAVIVKMADLRHNSDIRRIKEPGPSDFERTAKYRQFYLELIEALG